MAGKSKSAYHGHVRGARHQREFDVLNRDDMPTAIINGEMFFAIPEGDPRIHPESMPDEVEELVIGALQEAQGF
jgi:hypothetical protein